MVYYSAGCCFMLGLVVVDGDGRWFIADQKYFSPSKLCRCFLF
jgi:hypothetical protein